MKRFVAFLMLITVAVITFGCGQSVVAQNNPEVGSFTSPDEQAQQADAPAEVVPVQAAPAEQPAEQPEAQPAQPEQPAAQPEAQPGQQPAAEGEEAEAPLPPMDAMVVERVSYAIGMRIGTDLKGERENLNVEAVLKGLNDALGDKEPAFSQQEIEEAYRSYMIARQMRQQAQLQRMAQRNRRQADKFLAENRQKEGVQALESGVQYRVIKQGEGKSPQDEDWIKIRYTGQLIDGTVFATNEGEGAPAEVQPMPLVTLFPGLQEAISRMKTGGKWEIVLPPETALGADPSAPGGPNSVYIFTIELLEVTDAPATAPMPAPQQDDGAGTTPAEGQTAPAEGQTPAAGDEVEDAPAPATPEQ